MKAKQLLESTSSEPAGIIDTPKLAREFTITAISVLMENHEEQISILSILGGTRLKYHFHGAPVPTRRPNEYFGRARGKEGNFAHPLD